MALLVDYGSGSSDEEMDTETTVPIVVVQPKKNESDSEFVNTSSTFLKFDILPQPQESANYSLNEAEEEGPIPPKKTYGDEEIEKPPDTNLRTLSSSFTTLRAQKIGGVMKISVPSVKDFADDDDEESSGKKNKVIQPSKKGSGLFAILPEPKHANYELFKAANQDKSSEPEPNILTSSSPSSSKSVAASSTSSSINPTPKSFIPPQALLGKRPPLSKLDEIRAKYMKQEANVRIVSRGGGEKKMKKGDSDESDEEGSEDFFSFAAAGEEIPDDPTLRLPDYVPPEPTANSIHSSDQIEESYEMREELTETDVMKFVQKGRKSKADPINFIDVSAQDLRADSQDWLKAVTAEAPVTTRKRDAPGGLVKRKHQITYLAYEAKEREQALKSQWAQNHHNKRMTQSKYGF